MYRDEEIKRVYDIKFLGAFIDDKLSWNSHVNHICSTISKSIGVLYKLQFLPQNILKMLYYSFVSVHIKYCSIVWGFTTKKNIDRIHKLQKRSIRLITNSSYLAPSKPLFLKMKILPVQEFISLESMIFMFKVSNNVLSEVFHNHFTLNCSIHNYNTRNAKNIHTPLNRISKTQSSIFYHGPILWNTLPPTLKSSKTLRQFKRLYKKHIFDEMYLKL